MQLPSSSGNSLSKARDFKRTLLPTLSDLACAMTDQKRSHENLAPLSCHSHQKLTVETLSTHKKRFLNFAALRSLGRCGLNECRGERK